MVERDGRRETWKRSGGLVCEQTMLTFQAGPICKTSPWRNPKWITLLGATSPRTVKNPGRDPPASGPESANSTHLFYAKRTCDRARIGEPEQPLPVNVFGLPLLASGGNDSTRSPIPRRM